MSKHLVPFSKRKVIDTSPSADVRHLTGIKGTPLDEFLGLLKHEENFLVWVDERHEIITDQAKELKQLKGNATSKGPAGGKEGTFTKYRWYAEQLVVLEAINAFETFFKKTFIQLGTAVQDYVQLDAIKGLNIDARILWSITGQVSVPALVFEQSLFHDLDAIDAATHTLIGERRYNQNANKNALADRIRALRAIFQVRHTLSHNNGLVTDSDGAKFKRIRFDVKAKEVVDPGKDRLGEAIFKELADEAADFTNWLAGAASTYLTKCVKERGLAVPKTKLAEFEAALGKHKSWASVPWS